jgi:hypothetical protein
MKREHENFDRFNIFDDLLSIFVDEYKVYNET